MLDRIRPSASLAAGLALALAAGCSSAEKAPRAPVSGVDRPHGTRTERVEASASMLDPFVKDVALADWASAWPTRWRRS